MLMILSDDSIIRFSYPANVRSFQQWDLGEFDQKGSVPTRWGTKEQLLSAIAAAQAHGIDVLIDAVLNVWAFMHLRA